MEEHVLGKNGVMGPIPIVGSDNFLSVANSASSSVKFSGYLKTYGKKGRKSGFWIGMYWVQIQKLYNRKKYY